MWTAPGRKACLAFSRERHWRVEGSAVRSRSPAVNAAHILRSLAPCLSEILLHTITLLITGLRDRPLPQRWSGWKAHGMCTSRLSRDGLALCRPPRLVAVRDSIRPAWSGNRVGGRSGQLRPHMGHFLSSCDDQLIRQSPAVSKRRPGLSPSLSWRVRTRTTSHPVGAHGSRTTIPLPAGRGSGGRDHSYVRLFKP